MGLAGSMQKESPAGLCSPKFWFCYRAVGGDLRAPAPYEAPLLNLSQGQMPTGWEPPKLSRRVILPHLHGDLDFDLQGLDQLLYLSAKLSQRGDFTWWPLYQDALPGAAQT